MLREEPMVKCSRCGAETQLYEYGTPICIECSNAIEAEYQRPSPDPRKHLAGEQPESDKKARMAN
jgi:hypothetical protein